MPRNVRNFWIEADIDGRKSAFSGGPQSATGGIDITIKQRDGGSIITAARITGRVTSEGVIVLEMATADDSRRIEVRTER